MTPPASFLDHDDRIRRVVIEPHQAPTEERLAIDRFLRDQLRLTPRETAIVGDVPKGPIETRRRYLERIRHRDDLLDVEHRAQVTADVRAILDADAFLGC